MTANNELTPAEAATFLGYSRSHVYALMNQGELPYMKFRGRVFLRRDELEAWRAGQTVHHATSAQLASQAAAYAAKQ